MAKTAKKQAPITDEEVESIAPKNHNKIGGVDVAKLKSYVERVERLEEEKAGIAEDVKDVFAELKAAGLDVKATRKCIKLRKMKAEQRAEEEYQEDLYKRALGLTVDDLI